MLASPRFITAASDGDLEAVQTYLKEGLDVNSQDWDKLTALVAAASQGHLEVVKVLLDKVSLLQLTVRESYRADLVLRNQVLGEHRSVLRVLG